MFWVNISKRIIELNPYLFLASLIGLYSPNLVKLTVSKVFMKSTKRPSKRLKQQPSAQTQPQSHPTSADNPTEQYSEHQPVSNSDERPQQHNEVAIAQAITNPEQQSKPRRPSKTRTQKLK
jgi:mannitol-specific phosphotransferase system IIBC component